MYDHLHIGRGTVENLNDDDDEKAKSEGTVTDV